MRTGALLAILLALPTAARANPDSLVPTLAPPEWPGVQGSATNIFATVDYAYEDDSSQIYREQVGAPGTDPTAPLPMHREMAFHQTRHTITPRVEVGLLRDTWLYVALPIVVAQSHELKFDGVSGPNSTTVADMILPAGGYDANDPTTPPGGNLAFRGVGRHGLDQIHLGVGVAPMNQQRDDTKPTWRIGAEARLAIGKVMRFDPNAPTANTAVGYGVHELKLWTSFDRKLGWAEPWAEFFWQVPLAATSASLFDYPRSGPAFGAKNTDLSQQAGVQFGVEATLVDTDGNKIGLDLGGRATAHFEGRDYSEMWEVFAYAGNTGLGGPLVLNGDSKTAPPGALPMSHPGITNIENYLETAVHTAIRGELGPHVRFAVLGDVVWKSDHVITFADAGVDKNGDDLVNPGTAEVNPLHVDKIDLVGHRYHSVHGLSVIVGLQGQVLF